MQLSKISLFLLAGLTNFAVAATTPAAPATAAATATTSATASPASFNNTQQAAIEKIVHDYLIAHPEILMDMSQALQAKQQQAMQEKVQQVIPTLAPKLLHDKNSPVAGNPKADIAVVEFFDYQCPHCKDMGPEVDQLLSKNKNVTFIYKQLPIFGANSEFAAKAALASVHQGKYAVFHDALLKANGPLSNQAVLDIAKSVGLDTNKLQADMNQAAIAQEIKDAAALANQLGIAGTPAFVIVHEKDGKVLKSAFIPGQTTADDLSKSIDSVK